MEYKTFIDKDSTLYKFLDIEDNDETIDENEEWKKHWIGMPEFSQEKNPPFKKIYLNFRNQEDYDAFSKLINQNLSEKTKSIWYPKLERDENTLKRWIESDE
jgi:hypothetical protein